MSHQLEILKASTYYCWSCHTALGAGVLFHGLLTRSRKRPLRERLEDYCTLRRTINKRSSLPGNVSNFLRAEEDKGVSIIPQSLPGSMLNACRKIREACKWPFLR